MVSINMKWVNKGGTNRRTIFTGWDNYTDLEIEWIQKIKVETKKQLGVDLFTIKAYGPRVESGNVVTGESPILNGRDRFLDDAAILRLIVSALFDVEKTLFFMKIHLEWRQTSVPLPILTDKTLNLLN